MSTLKSKRKESKFEVMHHFYKLRKEFTDLVFRHFGFKGDTKFENWVVDGEAKAIMKNLVDIQRYITMANSIFPQHLFECDERRRLQNLAIGLCFDLSQELQFVLEVLPIDKNKFVRFSNMIDREIMLLKGWRQSDNPIRKKIEEKERGNLRTSSNSVSTNFANVNNNGNANNNNASNSNGVRPDSTDRPTMNCAFKAVKGEGEAVPAKKLNTNHDADVYEPRL